MFGISHHVDVLPFSNKINEFDWPTHLCNMCWTRTKCTCLYVDALMYAIVIQLFHELFHDVLLCRPVLCYLVLGWAGPGYVSPWLVGRLAGWLSGRLAGCPVDCLTD